MRSIFLGSTPYLALLCLFGQLGVVGMAMSYPGISFRSGQTQALCANAIGAFAERTSE